MPGKATALPAYLFLLVREIGTKSILFKQDVVLLQSSEPDAHHLSLNFTFPLPSSKFQDHARREVAFEIEALDCRGRQLLTLGSVQVDWQPERHSVKDAGMKNVSSYASQWLLQRNRPYVILAVGTAIASLVYLLLLIIYATLKCCHRSQLKKFLSSSPIAPKTVSAIALEDVHFKRKVILTIYVAFRVLYNFLFTFTGLISLVLCFGSVISGTFIPICLSATFSDASI